MTHIRIPGDESRTYILTWMKWTALCLALGSVAGWWHPVLFIPLYLLFALRAGWITRQACAELRITRQSTWLLMVCAWVPGFNVVPFLAFAWASSRTRTISSVDRRARFLTA